MKKLLMLAIFLVYSNMVFADSGISTVFLKDKEIFISTDNAGQIKLTNDGIPKAYPVWSKDGSMIAFLENTDETVALSRLVIINRDGKRLFSFLIHPVLHPGTPTGGMRYVERVEWVTNSKISVAGSINPSTGETIIFDLSTGKISKDFASDSYAMYSPDGLHIAYTAGVPHFSRNTSAPVLIIDDRPVYPSSEFSFDGINWRPVSPSSVTKVDYISNGAWSGDCKAFAIVATNRDTKISNIVIWHIGDAQPSINPVPVKETEYGFFAAAKLFWNGDGVFVVSDDQTWSFANNKLSEIPPSHAVDPKKEALNFRKTLVGSDFWCQSCPLSLLPRRSPLSDYEFK